MTRPLRIVASETTPEPPRDIYTRERQYIMARDWAAVHIAADKRTPFASIVGRWR